MTPDSINNTTQANTSPPLTLILTIILLVFFFLSFFSIYFCRCFLENLIYAWYFRRNTGAGTTVGPECTNGRPGLDPSIIDSFPTFTYSSVKDLRKGNYGLECAICLSEFLGDDILRLLTPCCHVFHQECIDLWLELHKTCPVCRRELDLLDKSPDKSPTPPAYHNSMHEINENEPLEDSFSITIKDDNEEDRGGQSEGAAPSTTYSEQTIDGQKEKEKFSRSHSTGHSIVRSGEDRFTLRLPEHLHARLIRGHNWTGSCTTFGEFKSKTSTGNGGFGEVSDFSGGDVKRV